MRSYKTYLTFLLVFSLGFNCQQVKNFLHKIRKDAYQKRYGVDLDQLEKKEEWEKQIAQYEKEIAKKIDAGVRAASVYRRLGEAYGKNKSYFLCAQNLKKAIDLGYDEASAYYTLGLCQGNLARSHSWPKDETSAAEKSFIRSLELEPTYYKSKYELGLIYFYGYGKNSTYSVLSDTVTVSQKKFQDKAIELITDFQFQQPTAINSYYTLANIYTTRGELSKARDQMKQLAELIKKSYPKDYRKNQDYINAELNLRKLSNY